MDLSFKIENQLLKRTDKKAVVNLSENYLKLCFEFSSDWDDVDKYILIYHDKKVTRLGLVNDSVTLSSQFLKSNRLIFTVYGETVEDNEIVYRITTNSLQINLIESKFTTNYDGKLDPVEDADVVEQLWSAINLKVNSTDLADVATSGEYSDLDDIPATFAPSSHTHSKSDITDFPTLATVATSGSYNDLSNRPTIPVVVQTVQNGNTNAVSSDAVYDYIQSVIGNANQWLTQ